MPGIHVGSGETALVGLDQVPAQRELTFSWGAERQPINTETYQFMSEAMKGRKAGTVPGSRGWSL